MKKIKVGLVTAWGECGMGYLAKNWVYTLNKFDDKLTLQIFSRAKKWLNPYRWYGDNVVQGLDSMDINNKVFWDWIESFKPDVLLFQDQNIYSKTLMQEESYRLKKLGIKLINYPDSIHWNEFENHKGLYHVNVAHVKRNYNWLLQYNLEEPTYIPWGVIIKNFPFQERRVKDRIKFYINIGTGTPRKGYNLLPKTINHINGNRITRLFRKKQYEFKFIASSIKDSEKRINKKFKNFFNNHKNCELIFKTADNKKGGLFNLGDVYIYPTHMEGVGLTITESMATGLPVVTPNFSTMNEWIDDNKDGRLIDIKKVKKGRRPTMKVYADTKHLAQIMIDYIENPIKVTEHSINARNKIIKDFNWDDRDEDFFNLVSI
tara:strand:+ start:1715 stop:2839 length:1125 start_codon:yes stop_codon:yes gene_type:complete